VAGSEAGRAEGAKKWKFPRPRGGARLRTSLAPPGPVGHGACLEGVALGWVLGGGWGPCSSESVNSSSPAIFSAGRIRVESAAVGAQANPESPLFR